MDNETQATLIALAVGVPSILAGLHVLERVRLSVTVRTIIGCPLLGAGMIIADQLTAGSGRRYLHPVWFGVSIALLELGINQTTAPFRSELHRAR